MKIQLFTIILPTKNNIRTITKCLDSIVSQTYKNIEVIFVDNFSTDWTYEIANSYKNKINIQTFQVWPERNIQRWFWFNKSRWEFVYFIDSDMYMSESIIEEAVLWFLKNAEIWAFIVPEDNKEWKYYWTKVKAYERSFYDWDDTIEAARIFRRDVYKNIWGYNEKMISWEDWDLSERVKSKYLIKRVKWRVIHDEWEIVLTKLLYKKYYYGKHFTWYVDNNKWTSIINKIYFLRPSFYKNIFKTSNKMHLIPWLIIMLTFELFAWWVWFIIGKFIKKW